MQDSIHLPTPATLYSTLVAPHIDEMLGLIAKAMQTPESYLIDGRRLRLDLTVKPSPACIKYFRECGTGRLTLPGGWILDKFGITDANTSVALSISGIFEAGNATYRD